MLAAYKEIETGKRADRPELARALAHAKRPGALVVCQIDRLARNVAFTSALMDAGVDFVACDQPHANRLTIHILAAVAEHEAGMISDRTRAALAVCKRRGGLLGGSRPECRNLTDKARAKGRANASKAIARTRERSLRRSSADHARMAGRRPDPTGDCRPVEREEQTTRRGKPWTQVQVMRVLSL